MSEFKVCQFCDGTGDVKGNGCRACGHTGQVKLSDPPTARRGRPKLDITDDERARRKRISREASRGKSKNVTIDADLVGVLNTVADELEAGFGFRPNLSQTLRHLIAKRNNP